MRGQEYPFATLLGILCSAAKRGIANLGSSLGFHPIKIFRSLVKQGLNERITTMFTYWPDCEQNPFVFPLCLYALYEDTDSQYNNPDFINIAQKVCPCPLFILALMFARNSQRRVLASQRLVAAGLDPNEITTSAPVNQFIFSCPSFKLTSYEVPDRKLFDLFEQLTPLAIAVRYYDSTLVHELIKLGANPRLV